MKTLFKRIKAYSVSNQAFEQIKELIFRSELKPGEQILPERELSVELGVSRTSVRNAISRGVVLGYFVNRQGQGVQNT